MKQLLELNGKDTLTVPLKNKELLVKGMDFEYDFNKKQAAQPLTIIPTGKEEAVSPYIINKELVNAVNAAIITGRPLLLKGEPGSGKTKLAKAVAAYFYGKELSSYYFEWHIKSRSNAQEGAYTFDHVKRLRDATLPDNDEDKTKAKDPANYVTLGPMGLAFVSTFKKGKPPILLIDEIDKGDIDFPNDLLLELDEMRFSINELPTDKRFISANDENKPLVFITSNNERELPPAFLRRCLYYRIPPFKADLLETIAKVKLDKFYQEYNSNQKKAQKLSDEEVTAIVKEFLEIKDTMSGVKPPSTSELLDWLKMILYQVNKEHKKIKDIIKDKTLQQITLKLLK